MVSELTSFDIGKNTLANNVSINKIEFGHIRMP